jgi:hypothetical protein
MIDTDTLDRLSRKYSMSIDIKNIESEISEIESDIRTLQAA